MKYRLAFSILALALFSADAAADNRVRPSALAGSWYPADRGELAALVDSKLDAADASSAATPTDGLRALIVPHAGYVFSGDTAAQGFVRVRGRHFGRVLLLAPSHHADFHGLSIADVDAYQTPLGDVPLDLEAISGLRASNLVQANPYAHVQEHSIEIELPFLQRALAPGWRLVPVLIGRLNAEDYGTAAALLRPLADADTLVVVSSDFTHFGPRFGYLPFPVDAETPERLRELDSGAIARIQSKDATGLLDYQRSTGITVCGIQPIALLLTMLPGDSLVERIAYTTSGALTGDYANSVSYAALAVTAPEPIAKSEPGDPPADPSAATAESSEIDATTADLLYRLAQIGIDEAVLHDADTGARLSALNEEQLPEALRTPAGAFVTLWKHGELRGCTGFTTPQAPLYQAVLESGYNAARNDPRFQPVRADELTELAIEVSVLTKPRRIDSYTEFQPGKHGIILDKDGRSAVYLPEVAPKMGWNREQTLDNLALKAGLPPDAWREGAVLRVFESRHFSAPYRPKDAVARSR
jgi:AmmeMemoRadiSam system protein B/AmmeMemoRadiSam system protein A